MFCFSSSSRIAWSWSWSQQDGAESGQHHQGSLFSEQSISLTTLPFFLHRPPLQLRGLGSCTSCSLFVFSRTDWPYRKDSYSSAGKKTNKKNHGHLLKTSLGFVFPVALLLLSFFGIRNVCMSQVPYLLFLPSYPFLSSLHGWVVWWFSNGHCSNYLGYKL